MTFPSGLNKNQDDKPDGKQSKECLRASLRSMALEKQKMSKQLHQCRQTNVQLSIQMRTDRGEYQAKLDRMQMEINDIRKSLVDTQIDFMDANRQLRENLQTTTRTTERLSLMFLRMRENKLNAERKRNVYEMLCRKFSTSIEEQAQLCTELAANGVVGQSALCRMGQLIKENTVLRLKRAADRMAATRTTRNRSNKLAKQLVNQLAARMQRQANVSLDFVGIRSTPMLCQKLCSGSEVTLFDRNDYLK